MCPDSVPEVGMLFMLGLCGSSSDFVWVVQTLVWDGQCIGQINIYMQ